MFWNLLSILGRRQALSEGVFPVGKEIGKIYIQFDFFGMWHFIADGLQAYFTDSNDGVIDERKACCRETKPYQRSSRCISAWNIHELGMYKLMSPSTHSYSLQIVLSPFQSSGVFLK